MSVTSKNASRLWDSNPRPTHYECVGPDGAKGLPPAEAQPCDALSAAIPVAKRVYITRDFDHWEQRPDGSLIPVLADGTPAPTEIYEERPSDAADIARDGAS